jgi:2-haloacid dehalogenase/putative hydrolase of the HAD superfamily
MPQLDGLFLDFYGTLVGGDRRAVESCCEHVIRDLKIDLTADQLGVEWGKGYFALSETCNDGHFRTLYQIECDSLVDTLEPLLGHKIDPRPYVTGLTDWLRNPPLFAETLPVLNELRKRGIPVCLVSNADDGDIVVACERTGIRTDHAVTSESAKSYKPDAQIWHRAFEATGWRHDRVLHVGDSLHSDVGGAKALGIGAVWLRRDVRISDIGTEHPDFQITDLRGLLDLVS